MAWSKFFDFVDAEIILSFGFSWHFLLFIILVSPGNYATMLLVNGDHGMYDQMTE